MFNLHFIVPSSTVSQTHPTFVDIFYNTVILGGGRVAVTLPSFFLGILEGQRWCSGLAIGLGLRTRVLRLWSSSEFDETM